MQRLRIAIAVALCTVGAVATYAWFAQMPGTSLLQALYFAGPAVLSIGVLILETAFFGQKTGQPPIPGMSLQLIGVILVSGSAAVGLAIGVIGQDELASMLITILVILVALPGALIFATGIVSTILHAFRRNRSRVT